MRAVSPPEMTLRIGFDLDGVLADLAGAYGEIEERLFGPNDRQADATTPDAGIDPEDPPTGGAEEPIDEKDILHDQREQQRHQEAIWHAIRNTENFWTQLNPLEPEAVPRLSALAVRYRWEVFFITQRPATAGETVQRQTQRWLIDRGFDLPTVIVVNGARGTLASALDLHYVVDDRPKNCVDVLTDSRAKPILVSSKPDVVTATSARKLGIEMVQSTIEALAILERVSSGSESPSLMRRVVARLGWPGGD